MEIIWSDLAVQQLDEIAEYVQDNYGELTSRKMVHKITEYVNKLKVYPQLVNLILTIFQSSQIQTCKFVIFRFSQI